MINGRIQAVTTRTVGAEVVAASTAWWVLVDDVSVFDPDGGMVLVEGTPREYKSVRYDIDEITFVDGITVDVGDRIEVYPPRVETVAQVAITGEDDGTDIVPVEVPHGLKTRIREGVRGSEAEQELVVLTVEAGGRLVLGDVVGGTGETVWGDPLGAGTDITSGGVHVRDAIMAESLSSNGDIVSLGVPLVGKVGGGPVDGWMDRFSAASVARKVFNQTASAKPTGETWGYAVIGATCRANRLYRISATVSARPGVSGGSVVTRIKVSANSPANLSSPNQARVDLGPATGATHTPYGYMQCFVGYTEDTDIEALVTYQGAGGATPEMRLAEICIEDAGPQGSYGGGAYRQLSPTDPAPTTLAPREWVSTWQGVASQVYREDGSLIDGSDAWGFVEQGNDPATPDGHRRSAVLFGGGAKSGEVGKTLSQALTGATVLNAEVWLEYQSWSDPDGGTSLLAGREGTALPNTLTDSAPTEYPESSSGQRWKAGMGMWVPVPTSWFAADRNVLQLGGGFSWALNYHGLAYSPQWPDASKRPHLRITYLR